MRRELGGTTRAAKTRVWYRKSLCTRVPPPGSQGRLRMGSAAVTRHKPPRTALSGSLGACPPSHHPCSARIPVNPFQLSQHSQFNCQLGIQELCCSLPWLQPGANSHETPEHPSYGPERRETHTWGEIWRESPGWDAPGVWIPRGPPHPAALLHKAPGACISGSSSRREEK